MRINVKKTKVMRMPGRKGRKLRIVINGKKPGFSHTVRLSLSMVTEYIRSIALAKKVFNQKKDLMCGSLSLQLNKKLIVKAIVWRIALYESET